MVLVGHNQAWNARVQRTVGLIAELDAVLTSYRPGLEHTSKHFDKKIP